MTKPVSVGNQSALKVQLHVHVSQHNANTPSNLVLLAGYMRRACPLMPNLQEGSNGIQVLGKIYPAQGNRKCNMDAQPSMHQL